MQRVAITGIGLVTPLGLTAAENVRRACAGESGIAPARAFEVDGHKATALATVADFELESALRFPKNFKFMGRSVRFAMRAAREALEQSGLDLTKLDATRVGIQVGSGQTGVEYDDFFPSLIMAWDGGKELDYKYLGGLPSHLIDRYICLRTLANGGVALLSTEFGLRGPNGDFTQKDTASAMALNAAWLDLLEGRCDVALAGGYDSLATPGNFLAYEQAGLLSYADAAEACRPFHGSDGLVLGEGSGFLVLERWEHAVERGAAVLGEFLGAGASMGDMAQWRPAWTAETICRAACQATGGARPDFVVAAGLSTAEEDRTESAALHEMAVEGVPITALKNRTGYMGAPTAAVELGLGLLCARQGVLPAVSRNAPAQPLGTGDSLGLFLSCSWGGSVAAMAVRAVGPA